MKKINKFLLTTLTALTILFTSTVSSANVVEAASGDKFPKWYSDTVTLVKDDGTKEICNKYIIREFGNCEMKVVKADYKKKTVTFKVVIKNSTLREGSIVNNWGKLIIQYGYGFKKDLSFTKTLKLNKKYKKMSKKNFNKMFKKGTKYKINKKYLRPKQRPYYLKSLQKEFVNCFRYNRNAITKYFV